MAQQNTVAVPYLHVHYFLERYLVAFAKMRSAAITFVMSVYLSVCQSFRLSVSMEQLGSHWTDWHEVSYLSIFRKFVENVPVSLKYDKNNGYIT